jgi:hypothetical protein
VGLFVLLRIYGFGPQNFKLRLPVAI